MYNKREFVLPLTIDVTTDTVLGNKMCVTLTSSSLILTLQSLLYMITGPGYDDKYLYEYNKKVLGIDPSLLCR